MKKWIAVLLSALMAMSLLACGGNETGKETSGAEGESRTETKKEIKAKEYMYRYSGYKTGITAPMSELPSYVLNEGATVEEMRAAVVQAMHDEITVPWVTPETLTITSGEKSFEFTAGTIYGGLPYGGNGSGLFSLLLYLNPQTGLLEYLEPNQANTTFGNTCSTSVCWGWNAACASAWNCVATWAQTKTNGIYPIGEVDYPDSVLTFKMKSTLEIITENGQEKCMEAYALLQPGDDVVVVGGNIGDHSMMIREAAKVVRKEDGSIDPEKSTVIIQDQHKQHDQYEEDGQSREVRGHTAQEYTFQKLWDAGYLAVAPGELLGKLPYTVPEYTIDTEVTDLESLRASTLKSTYRICGAWVEVFYGDTVVFRYIETFAHSKAIENYKSGYKLNNIGKHVEIADELVEGVEYRIVVKTVNSAGLQYTVGDFNYTK